MTALDERLDVLETQIRELRYAAGVEPRAAPLGFFQVQPGETILSDHMNTAILQGVPPFASAAARSAAIPSPAYNRFSVLDTAQGRQEYWTGTEWKAYLVRANFTKTTDGANGNLTITAAELGIATLSGAFASVSWNAAFGSTNQQIAQARISANTVQVRIWAVSAGTAGTLNIMTNATVLVHVVAW